MRHLIAAHSLSPRINWVTFYTDNGSSMLPTNYTRVFRTYTWWSLWVSVDSQSCGTSLSQLSQTWHASLFPYCLLLTAFQWFMVSREIPLQSILFAWREKNVDMIRDKAIGREIGREAAKKAPHVHAHMQFVVFQTFYFPRGRQGFF